MNNFVVFPAFGYWEIDGSPVSSKEAMYGAHPHTIWRETEVARNLTTDEKWECSACHHKNHGLLSHCEACGKSINL